MFNLICQNEIKKKKGKEMKDRRKKTKKWLVATFNEKLWGTFSAENLIKLKFE